MLLLSLSPTFGNKFSHELSSPSSKSTQTKFITLKSTLMNLLPFKKIALRNKLLGSSKQRLANYLKEWRTKAKRLFKILLSPISSLKFASTLCWLKWALQSLTTSTVSSFLFKQLSLSSVYFHTASKCTRTKSRI